MSVGNRPDYHLAMPPTEAKEFWNLFVSEAKSAYKPDMVFGMSETLRLAYRISGNLFSTT